MRGGDIAEDTERQARRDAYIFVIKSLWENPEHCMAIQSALHSRLTGGPKNDPERFATISTVGKLEPGWLAGFIAEQSKLRKADLERALVFDDDSLRQVLQFLLSCAMSTKLPAECEYKAVTKSLLAERATQVGKRASRIAEAKDFVDQSGRLNWVKYGIYKLHWSEDGAVVTHVEHAPTSTKVAMPNGTIITSAYSITANWNEKMAVCSLGPTKVSLMSFFEGQTGPNSVPPWPVKVMQARASELCKEHQDRLKALQGGTGDAEDFSTFASKKKVSANAAARARQALATRRKSIATKRMQALSAT